MALEDNAEMTARLRARAARDTSRDVVTVEPLRSVVAHAPDGVIEAVEWTGDANWIVGVQWHPERMVAEDELARSLFRELAAAAAARKAPVHS